MTPREDFVETARDARIEHALATGHDVVVVGASASGKTSSAQLAARRKIQRGGNLLWLDLAVSDQDAASLLQGLTRLPATETEPLVILDNLQARPSAGYEALRFVSSLRASLDLRLTLLVLTWPSARSVADAALPGAISVPAGGDEVIIELARAASLDESEMNALGDLAKGDVVLAGIALTFHRENARMPHLPEAADLVGTRLEVESTTREERKLLYWLAALGSYEVEVPRTYARQLPAEPLGQLLARRLVVEQGDSLTIGHRSQAALLVVYAHRHWPEDLVGVPSPPRLAVDYLRGAGDRRVRATLERLDLVGLASGDDQHGSGFLARAWQSLTVLSQYLARQLREDPTWGDNLASAVFACETLAELDQPDAWALSAAYVRERWTVTDDQELPEAVGPPSAESFDFPEIVKRMHEEDEGRGARPLGGMPADAIDLERFHRTWVLGLLLGFEGSAQQRDPSKLTTLKTIAASQQEPDGSFYPARVPWVTARIVLGLARAGENYESSRTVRRACDWLRTGAPAGPYTFGAWESGTGSWNSELMTTAMCLTALAQAGVPLQDRCLRDGQAYLKHRRSEWASPGNEIDTALVLEATLLTGGRWRELGAELGQLLAWAESRSSWLETGRLASDLQTESSKVPFVVGGLVGIVWATVKRELPLLLEGVGGPWTALSSESPSPSASFVPAADHRSDVLLALQQLVTSVDSHIVDRQAIISSSRNPSAAQNERLAEWLSRRRTVSALLVRAEQPPSSVEEWAVLLAEIDALGQQVLQAAWRPLGKN